MKIINVRETQKVETPHKVDVRKIYDYNNAQAMHITLQSGETLKPHITPVDVFFYILEGAVDVRVGDETITVEKDNKTRELSINFEAKTIYKENIKLGVKI